MSDNDCYTVCSKSFSLSQDQRKQQNCVVVFPDDDQFSKLKAVFLATGRGHRQDLPLVDVQLLLLKDEGSKTLDATGSFFQQLLKPDLVKTVLLSHLRYLW